MKILRLDFCSEAYFGSKIVIIVDNYSLERPRGFLSPFGRTIGFAVRFERSGPPKIFDFGGERRH